MHSISWVSTHSAILQFVVQYLKYTIQPICNTANLSFITGMSISFMHSYSMLASQQFHTMHMITLHAHLTCTAPSASSGTALLESFETDHFDKKICKLVAATAMNNLDITSQLLLLDEVVLRINVLHSGVFHCFFHDRYSSNIVSVNLHSSDTLRCDASHNLFDLQSFIGCLSCHH
jgi:hypothetical protein